MRSGVPSISNPERDSPPRRAGDWQKHAEGQQYEPTKHQDKLHRRFDFQAARRAGSFDVLPRIDDRQGNHQPA